MKYLWSINDCQSTISKRIERSQREAIEFMTMGGLYQSLYRRQRIFVWFFKADNVTMMDEPRPCIYDAWSPLQLLGAPISRMATSVSFVKADWIISETNCSVDIVVIALNGRRAWHAHYNGPSTLHSRPYIGNSVYSTGLHQLQKAFLGEMEFLRNVVTLQITTAIKITATQKKTYDTENHGRNIC